MGKMACEQTKVNEDYLNGYMAGMEAAREERRRLADENETLRYKLARALERYDMDCLSEGDIVETTEGYLAVLTSEDTDESWNMVYADGKGDNMTKRCFKKTGRHLDLNATPFSEVLRQLKPEDTDW